MTDPTTPFCAEDAAATGPADARETGANEQQVLDAGLRMHEKRTQPRKLPHGPWPCPLCLGDADGWAPCFVPPGQVIADAANVLSAAEVEAIGKAYELLRHLTILVKLPNGDLVPDYLRHQFRFITDADLALLARFAEGAGT